MVSPVEEHMVNLWAIVDAHKREDPDWKVLRHTRICGIAVIVAAQNIISLAPIAL